MATSKERKDKLFSWADDVIRHSKIYDSNKHEIKNESYDGQTAAFSVSVAMFGLKPTMVLYYNNDDDNNTSDKKTANSESEQSKIIKNNIVSLIFEMFKKDIEINDNDSKEEKERKEKYKNLNIKKEEDLYDKIIEANKTTKVTDAQFRKDIVSYAIALKLVIRTFQFKKS